MPHLINALLSVLVVTGVLAGPSLRPRLALLLGVTGSVVANHLVWLVAPRVWSHALTPWAASVGGALLTVAAWSLLRTSPTAASLVDPDVVVRDDGDPLTGQGDPVATEVLDLDPGAGLQRPPASSVTPGRVRRLTA
ncbi:hypothetical protein DEI91_11745 [Curtobacterium sp. MCBD17_032]|nr:hypothetical protein DEI91_11745 [Curtobacterium sp. MCBD17_032]